MSRLKIWIIAFVAGLSFHSFAQDKIYKKTGGILQGKVDTIIDNTLFYFNSATSDKRAVPVSEVDLIKYANGNVWEPSSGVTLNKAAQDKPQLIEKKFDRNDPAFVDFANGAARQMCESVLLKKSGGKVMNSSVAVYFDSVYKDPLTNIIHIPIKISFERSDMIDRKFIKGTIKVSPDGTREWAFENAGDY